MPAPEYTHVVGVECPECGALTTESWPFPHCWKCGNRNWPENETLARKAKHDAEREAANAEKAEAKRQADAEAKAKADAEAKAKSGGT